MGSVEGPVYSQFQRHMQAAYVHCGSGCLCSRGERVNNSLVRRVSEVLHSSDRSNAGQAIITLERNCRFKSLKMKLGRLKRHYNDMGTLIAALVKYADSDNTKDLDSNEEKPEKGKKNGGAKGQQHNQGAMGIMVSAK